MVATKYFINPFGISGDLTAVPDNTQPSGTVSYQQGFPIGYELVQTDPSSLDVPRTQTNQLFNDITTNIQQYQQVGFPNFITASQNAGSAFPYQKNAIVNYDDGTNGPRNFMSRKNANTDLPTVKASWFIVDETSNAVALDGVTFDGAVAQGNAVYYDSVSATFKQALANGAAPQKVIGFADVTFSRVFMIGYVGFMTGLTPGATYYLSTTTAGAITNIIPATNVVEVGIAKSATELYANIDAAASLFSASIVQNGYSINNQTGEIEQWGLTGVFPNTGTTTSTVNVTLPIAFPSNLFSITTSSSGACDALGTTTVIRADTFSLTAIQFDAVAIAGSGFSASTVKVRWHAIGN